MGYVSGLSATRVQAWARLRLTSSRYIHTYRAIYLPIMGSTLCQWFPSAALGLIRSRSRIMSLFTFADPGSFPMCVYKLSAVTHQVLNSCTNSVRFFPFVLMTGRGCVPRFGGGDAVPRPSCAWGRVLLVCSRLIEAGVALTGLQPTVLMFSKKMVLVEATDTRQIIMLA